MLQVIILADGTTVPHKLMTRENGMYEITFTPVLPVRHRVHLTFNEEYVPGKYDMLFFYIIGSSF